MPKSKTSSEQGRASRRKGKTGELEVAKLFAAVGIPARRGQQYAGDIEAPDVVVSQEYRDLIDVEVKRTERLKLTEWMRQQREDTDNSGNGVIFHRRNLEEWNVILPAEFFLKIFKVYADDILESGLEF